MNQRFRNLLAVALMTTVSGMVISGKAESKAAIAASPQAGLLPLQQQSEKLSAQPVERIGMRSSVLASLKQMQGIASWYGPGFHGRRTANGERFDQGAMTAAHRSLPFGTRVRVTNLRNGRSIIVRINDRGPYVGGRIIDLSAAAARALKMVRSGIAPVRIEVLGR